MIEQKGEAGQGAGKTGDKEGGNRAAANRRFRSCIIVNLRPKQAHCSAILLPRWQPVKLPWSISGIIGERLYLADQALQQLGVAGVLSHLPEHYAAKPVLAHVLPFNSDGLRAVIAEELVVVPDRAGGHLWIELTVGVLGQGFQIAIFRGRFRSVLC